MRIAIVEDEAVVARRLERMVRGIVGEAGEIAILTSVGAALELMRDRTLDLLFLDLNLNGRDGFRLLEEAAAAPFRTIVVSAHHDQALRAFDYGVTDFVAKPWSEERLRLAIRRATGMEAAPETRAGRLVVRKGRETRWIPVEQILYVRGADDYSEIRLDDGTSHLHEKSLSVLGSLLPISFARVHRSYIVNLDRSRGVRSGAGGKTELILENGDTIPVGRAYRAEVRRVFL